jgi:glycosyltransferase involved in cell wall biosynthesis
MGKLWCAAFPTVTVPHSDMAKPVTVVVPYYENPQFFKTQLTHWSLLADDLLAHVRFIVVDDGSPDQPLTVGDGVQGVKLRVFRILVDVRWNWLAARNIGMHHAEDGWCLLTDIDHIIPETTFRRVVYGQHEPDVIYAFSRAEHTGEPINPHSASFLMTRKTFWKVGGYDEALSGHYGTDGDFRRRCAAVAPFEILSDRLIRHEYQGDSSTARYQRKQPEDAAVRGIVASRGKGWRPKVLSFPYEEVTLPELAWQ